MKYIKEFSNHAAYTAYTASTEFVTPNVSYCNEENEVHYNPYVPPTPPTPSFKYKFTLNDSSVVTGECDATSAVTKAETSAYSSTLVAVEIGDCVTSIGSDAFRGCDGLTSCTIGSGVTTIGDSAFAYCTSLQSITCLATTPPTLVSWGVLEETNDCPIYVPAESVDAYKAEDCWSDFEDRIQPIS